MTGTLKLFITAAIITCGTAVYSQTDDTANKVLEKVVEALQNDECDRAQRNYNIWKNLTGKTKSDIETKIKACGHSKEQGDKQRPNNEVTSAYDKGVVINGVRWATRNVDKPGTFAKNPEDAGMFYQWNRKIGWSSTDPMINSDGGTTWDDSYPEGDTWEKANDPSPAGWRVPTQKELKSLTDKDHVTIEWTDINGIYGNRFTDKATDNSLFLPAVGYSDNGLLFYNDDNTYGHYWSSTLSSHSVAYYLLFYNGNFNVYRNDYASNGFSVRCVAE